MTGAESSGPSIAIVVLFFAYFLPSVVAWARGSSFFSGIFVLNLFTGWTFFGWVAALVWACASGRK